MACSIGDAHNQIILPAMALGWVNPHKNRTFSSGCSAAHAAVSSAKGFLEDRENAKLAEKQRLVDIETARLAKIEDEKQRLVDIETARLAKIENARLIVIEEQEMFNVLNLERIEREKQIQNQIITFNEQQNSGDFNDTPITEINLNNSCSECTGTKSSDPIPEKQLTESYLKIGGIAAVGVGILLLYTRSNKK